MSTTNYLLSTAAANADTQLKEAINSVRGALNLHKEQKPDVVLVAAYLNFQIGMVLAWQLEETKDALEAYLPVLARAADDLATRLDSLDDAVDGLLERERGEHEQP